MTSSTELHPRRAQAVARGVSNTKAIYAKRADNAEIWDEDGRRYVDFAAGIAVVNTGHQHPKLIAAVADAAADEGRQRQRAHSAGVRHVWKRDPVPRAAYGERRDRARGHGPFRQEPCRACQLVCGGDFPAGSPPPALRAGRACGNRACRARGADCLPIRRSAAAHGGCGRTDRTSRYCPKSRPIRSRP